MAKHTQIICLLLSTNCLSVFDHFVGLVRKGLTIIFRALLKFEPCATTFIDFVSIVSLFHKEDVTEGGGAREGRVGFFLHQV